MDLFQAIIARRGAACRAIADGEPIRKVCAWCNTVVAPGTLPATHTICLKCFVRVNAELDEKERGA